MKPELTADRLGLADLLELSDLLLATDLFSFRVAGWSMFPTLRKGDLLMIEPASLSQLRVGDLILFHREGQLICHRLVGLETGGPAPQLVTKGDAATEGDAPLEPGQILGRVVDVRRSGLGLVPLAMRIDQSREWLTQRVARCLQALQGLRLYRRILSAACARWVTYEVGLPQGSRWYDYQRIAAGEPAPQVVTRQSFRLLAKVAGTAVGRLCAEPRGQDYWITGLTVRLRFRGLGLASKLLGLACTVAARNGSGRVMASLESDNQQALRLYEKMGFRLLPTDAPTRSVIVARPLDDVSGSKQPTRS